MRTFALLATIVCAAACSGIGPDTADRPCGRQKLCIPCGCYDYCPHFNQTCVNGQPFEAVPLRDPPQPPVSPPSEPGPPHPPPTPAAIYGPEYSATPTPTPSATPPPPAGWSTIKKVGVVVAVVAGIIVMIIFMYCCCCRRGVVVGAPHVRNAGGMYQRLVM